jgi:hypothetical protein
VALPICITRRADTSSPASKAPKSSKFFFFVKMSPIQFVPSKQRLWEQNKEIEETRLLLPETLPAALKHVLEVFHAVFLSISI